MMKAIETRALDYIRRQRLIEDGDVVLIALSGGGDSVCLLHVLLALRERLHLRIFAAHYNHQLRGAESMRDEAFVRDLCERLDVPLTTASGDVAAEAKRTGRSIEETARAMCYAFLEQSSEKVGAHKIATGHHADDNAETVLLHLTRGAGLRGLTGIPPKRGQIVRPLLATSRQEILEYLAYFGQDFVEDGTNQDTIYRRNAIRHLVMPVLQEQNPNLLQAISRQSEILRRDASYLDKLAMETFAELRGHCRGELCSPAGCKTDLQQEVGLPAKALLDLDLAISTRVVALAIQTAGGEAEEVHIRQVLELAQNAKPSAKADLRGLVVRREYDRLIFTSQTKALVPFTPRILPPEGTILIPEAGIRLRVLPKSSEKEAEIPTFLFQSASICGKITIRPRQVGDSMRLNAAGGTKTIKKLMIECKIPAHKRDILPVFSDDLGVIAVFGIGTCVRVAPNLGDEVLGIIVEELESDA